MSTTEYKRGMGFCASVFAIATMFACGARVPMDDAALDWTPPVLVTTLSGDDPSLTGDLLELYFDEISDEIFVMTRADSAAAWSDARAVPELLDASAIESTPEVSADGATLLFSSTRDGGPDLDVWITSRAGRTAPWAPPARIVELASPDDDFSASMSADGLVLVLVRATGGRNLYLSQRATIAEPWPSTLPIDELNSLADDSEPHLASDALTITFSSTRAGSEDLFIARRPSRDAPFAAPEPLPTTINTGANETDPWMSADQLHLYFMRGSDLWCSTR